MPDHTRLDASRERVLDEARLQYKMNTSVLEMLKRNTPLEDLARIRDVWVTPIKELINELEAKMADDLKEDK